MSYDILSRWTGAVLLRGDKAESLEAAIKEALAHNASLVGARLDGARLDGARLDGARLDNASLVGARLDNARLDNARLDNASLVGAHLVGASLVGARLDGARLDNASLVGARLDGASLVGARLDNARLDNARLDGASGLTEDQLRLANLAEVESDLLGILSYAGTEAQFLAEALKNGRVHGSAYDGDCACLVGTIAIARKCAYTEMPGIRPDSGRAAEAWFCAIRTGDTPENSPICKITYEWVVAWIERMRLAFGSAQ